MAVEGTPYHGFSPGRIGCVCDEASTFFFVSQNYDDNNILGVLFSLLISLMNRLFVLAKYQITSPSAVSECNTRRKSHSLTVSHIIAPLFARTTFKNQPLLVRLPLFLYTALFHL